MFYYLQAKKQIALLFLLLVFLLVGKVMAAVPPTGSCQFWPSPVQSYKSAGALTMPLNSQITANSGNSIYFPSFTAVNAGAKLYCPNSSSLCTRVNQAVRGISLPTFQQSSDTSTLDVTGTQTVTGNLFGYIKIHNGTGNLTIQPAASGGGKGPVLIKELNIGNTSDKVTLTAPGEYWINDFKQASGTYFDIAGSGDIVIYINNSSFDIGSSLPSNSFAGRLGIVGYGSAAIQNGSTLKAAVYTVGNVTLNNGSITGPVTVGNQLVFNGTYTIDATGWGNFSGWGGTCLPIDHYEISYPTTTQVGQSAAIVLKACEDSACTLYAASSTVNVNTSVTPAATLTWSSNPVTFVKQSSGVTLGSSTATAVTFSLGTVTPSANNALKCYNSSGLDATCSMNFVAVDHYELSYPSSALNCENATVTVKACQNSDCSTLSTSSSQVTLSATGGSPTWSSNPLTFTGSGSVTLTNPTASTVVLGISSSSPVATNALKCYKDGVLDAACSMSFVASQFSFNIPTTYANQETGDVTLRAIQSVPLGSISVCKAALTGSKNISFTRSYVLPNSGTLNPAIRDTSAGSATTITSATAVPLTFDANGEAKLRFSYKDAGVLGITASWSSGSLSLTGTDNVAVLPEKIALSASGNSCSGSTQASYLACSKYKMVNEAFTVTGTAGYTSSGSLVTTPNFGTSQLTSQPQLQNSLLAPSDGTAPSQGSVTMSFSSGTGSSSYSIADVGVYALGVADFVPYPSYQDETTQLKVPVSWSGPVGRIVPRNLLAVTSSAGSFAPQCSASTAYSYIGYAMGYQSAPVITVYGVDENGNHLANYKGSYARVATLTSSAGSPSWSYTSENLGSDNATALAVTASSSYGTWSTSGSGQLAVYTLGADTLTLTKSLAARVTPFTAIMDLLLNTLTDPDGVTLRSTLTIKPTGHEIRYGRLNSSNVYGPENQSLTLPFWSEYWSGASYLQNSEDSCTQLLSSWLSLNDAAAGTLTNITLRQGTGGSTTASQTNSGILTGGEGSMVFSAPGSGHSGYVDVGLTLPSWLQDYWDGSSLTALPAPRASFGLYKGSGRLIYRREVSN